MDTTTTPTELETRRSTAANLRAPAVVMAPTTLGAARLHRYSFNRTMLRRASADGWAARNVRLDLDAAGRGEAVYEADLNGTTVTFVAFTTTFDESEHTDRVVADRWEITGALVEGVVSDADLAVLRESVPGQEASRFDARVLVLTRGNRSVRFFESLVETLANGRQPEADDVADAGYIMRSTAFYGNGKYGMRSFEGYAHDHPLRVPYRAQVWCAWLFRELSYDVVEHCARVRGGARAVRFDDQWRRYFGLGNATGLGLVPYAMKHPRVIDAWLRVRETALAEVRESTPSAAALVEFDSWLERAARHFGTGSDDDCRPFLNARQLVAVTETVRDAWIRCRHDARPFDSLARWGAEQDAETCELITSLLIEMHRGDDDVTDAALVVDEAIDIDPTTTVGELRQLLSTRFAWLTDLDLDRRGADHFAWVISDNTEEPRRVPRGGLDIGGREVAIDAALRLHRLGELLIDADADLTAPELMERYPQHRLAVKRLLGADTEYGEPHDNVCSDRFLPLQLQRFQLAMYGMDNFAPKSTDWLRVTFFQGAPRLSDLGTDAMRDDWVWPARPESAKAERWR